MNVRGLPNYGNLDLTGEARQAAERMEHRAREPASAEMFAALVEPVLPREPGACILEVGAGSGALGRRMALARPNAQIFLTDKSEGMLAFAQRQLDGGLERRVSLAQWDVLEPDQFPFGAARFSLIVSSVMVPYLTDAQTEALVKELAARLEPGGTLLFLEQDLQSDAVNFPDDELLRKAMGKHERALKRTVALGLRPVLRGAGLTVLPTASHLWTEDHYGPYLRDLLRKTAEDAERAGRITGAERARWLETLEALAASGDFHYGLVYHRVMGRK